MRIISILMVVLTLGLLLGSPRIYPFPSDMDLLPGKGRNDFGCITCHLTSSGGGLNYFGFDYARNDFRYDDGLARMDSDGDGYTNGQEISNYPATNPGDHISFPWKPPNILTWLLTIIAVTGTIVAAVMIGVRSYGAFSPACRGNSRRDADIGQLVSHNPPTDEGSS